MRFKLFLLLLFSWCLSSDMALADVRKGDVTFKSIKTDSIEEDTTGAGVTIAGATVKDGGINGIFSGPGSVPIGGMVAVMPTTHANAWQPPEDCTTVKDGFVRAGYNNLACSVPVSCTDCVIPGGTTLPLMNNASYPRGGDTSGGTGGANTESSNVTVAEFTNPYVPKHYHSEASHSTGLTAAGQSFSGTTDGESSHTHSIDPPPTSTTTESFTQSGDAALYYDNPSGAFHSGIDGGIDMYVRSDGHIHSVNIAAFSSAAGSNHTHPFSGSTSGSGVTGYVGEDSGGCNGDTDATCQTTGGSVSLDNNAVNNEPKYVSVVWVIRVK